MSINERIVILRKTLNLSQSDFAEHLGVSRGVIVNFERATTTPKPQFIDLMCKVFSVNRKWLETGEGEMFRGRTREEELSEWAASLSGVDDQFKQRFVYALSRLDETGWRVIERLVDMLYEEQLEEQRKQNGE